MIDALLCTGSGFDQFSYLKNHNTHIRNHSSNDPDAGYYDIHGLKLGAIYQSRMKQQSAVTNGPKRATEAFYRV